MRHYEGGRMITVMSPRKSGSKLAKTSLIQGPIVHLKVLGRSYVYLNDFQIMTELFEKRGNIYSSRPRLVMNEL